MSDHHSNLGSKTTLTQLTPRPLVDRRNVLLRTTAFSLATATPLGPILAAHLSNGPGATQIDFSSVKRNSLYQLDRPLTPRELATTYNNFFEFGSHKQIWKSAQQLPLHPWPIQIDGLIENKLTTDSQDLIQNFPLEERWLRHRCVEAWSMAVPWIGFPLKALVDFAKPLPDAKYVKMTSFLKPKFAAGQRQHWLPWPYVESVTIEEALNPLAMIAVGMYGEPLPPQNGAPLRLVLPWKYGFKSIKSIQSFTFVADRPTSFWQEIAGKEYGFWANVNPEVPHPRWSQQTEKALGTDSVVPTKLYNGYADFVAPLYINLKDENLYM